MKFKFDVLTRWCVLGLGVDLGTNKIVKGRRTNFFIEITVLFWTFSFEVVKNS